MTWERIIDGGEERGELLGGAYRPIRRLATVEAPVPGELAAVGDDTVVLVDVEELAGWPGWAHGRSQHVCGVTDVARRARGHDAVLPRCVLRLDAALRAAPPLSGGEAVTLAVSLLRGAGEVQRAPGSDGALGAWWLTAEGRPAFVPAVPGAAGGEDCGAAAARILADAGATVEDRIVRRLLDEACGLLDDPDTEADAAEALEERLFKACAPRPLGRLLEPPPGDDDGERIVGPGRVADRRTRRELRAARGPRRRPGAGARGLPSQGAADARIDLREAIDAALAGRLAEGFSEGLAELRRRLAALRDRRGAPFVLGAAAAAVVVVGGLVWPSDETPAAAESAAQAGARGGSGEDAGAAPTPSPVATRGGSQAGAESGPPARSAENERDAEGTPEAGAEDPVAAAERLLDGLAVCRAAGDDVCAAVRAAGSAPLELADGAAAWLPADERRVVLLDDFGDLAVLRVEAPEGAVAPQSLVIERASTDERWIVRDVHDGASAPGTTEGDG